MVLALGAPWANAAATYNAVTDFNAAGGSQSLGAVWTYGSANSAGNGNSFNGFEVFGSPNSCGGGQFPQTICTPAGAATDQWWGNVGGNGPYLFGVGRNVSGAPIGFTGSSATIPNNTLFLGGGGTAAGLPNFTVVRFTAPAAAIYNLTGTIGSVDPVNSSFDAYITINVGSPTLMSLGNFSFTNLNLAAGATVDFVMDVRGDRSNDSMLLTATLTTVDSQVVPEPSTGAMAFCALAGVTAAWVRKRRATKAAVTAVRS